MGMSLKYLGGWAVITAMTFSIGYGGDWIPFLIWLLVSGPAYIASLYLHPRRPCWTCEGSGKHSGLLFDYGNRACATCGGSGRRPRLGARMLHIPAD